MKKANIYSLRDKDKKRNLERRLQTKKQKVKSKPLVWGAIEATEDVFKSDQQL